MIHRDYCSKCKKKDVPLIKYAKIKQIQYYYCRECNNLRARNYYKNGGAVNVYRAIRKSNAKNPQNAKARLAVSYAITTNKLTKPKTCEDCGLGGRIQGHHTDYNKPLDVVWVCIACHADRHKVKC